jgi:membrane protein implicated in regulation of membrane protease activity
MIIVNILGAVKNLFKIKEKSLSQPKQHKLIGKEVIVFEEIDTKKGTGKVMLGESWWIAVSHSGKEVIRKGNKVKIIDVKGYKLIVDRV